MSRPRKGHAGQRKVTLRDGRSLWVIDRKAMARLAKKRQRAEAKDLQAKMARRDEYARLIQISNESKK